METYDELREEIISDLKLVRWPNDTRNEVKRAIESLQGMNLSGRPDERRRRSIILLKTLGQEDSATAENIASQVIYDIAHLFDVP